MLGPNVVVETLADAKSPQQASARRTAELFWPRRTNHGINMSPHEA